MVAISHNLVPPAYPQHTDCWQCVRTEALLGIWRHPPKGRKPHNYRPESVNTLPTYLRNSAAKKTPIFYTLTKERRPQFVSAAIFIKSD